MLERVSSRTLGEWRAFAQLEPFGDQRADLRMGQLTAIVANAMRAKGSKAYDWTDFAYGNSKRKRATTDDDMLDYVKQLHSVYTVMWEQKNGNKSKQTSN